VCLCVFGATLALGFPNNLNLRFETDNWEIIGGEDAQKGEFPWQVSLHHKKDNEFRHSCGGSIIDATHIVCAGHCVHNRLAENMLIIAGAHNITDKNEHSQQQIPVKSFTIHEKYNGIFIANDISIIELESPIQFDKFAKPATLCKSEPEAGVEVVNSGWGNAHPQGGTPVIMPDILQKVSLEAISRDTCKSSYPLNIREHMVCAIGTVETPSGACNGDSGGPLIYKPNGSEEYCLVGIVSFGKQPCGNAPSVYTSVPFFLDWIAQHSDPKH